MLSATVMDQVVEINGVKLLAVALKDTGMNELAT